MFGNGETTPARQLPSYEFNAIPAREGESDLVQAARAYDEARRSLSQLREERDRIDEGIKDCMGRMDEAARHMASIIQPAPRKA